MAKFKINIYKIDRELYAIDNSFNKMQMGKDITGLSYTTVQKWELEEAPPIVELIYYNSKALNHSFLEMIQKNFEKFPVLKLLMHYHRVTGNPIENVIIKEK